MPNILTYHQELYRKFVHIFSCGTLAFLFWYFGKENLLPFIITISFLFPFLDYLKKYIPIIKNISLALFGNITRPHEHRAISGASWVLIGSGITAYLFNEKVVIIALIIMALSDSAAALVGIRYGTTRLFNKSLEGSLAFFIATYIIIFLLSSPSFMLLLIASIISTIVELFSTQKFNDNILIPVVIAFILDLGGIH